MHELAVTRSLIDLVDREAKKQGFQRALEIRLKVGAYSGIVPECILDLFPYASRDTAAEGAELVFETVPARFSCPDCGWEGEIERGQDACPRCGSTALKMTRGREFYVDSLKVE